MADRILNTHGQLVAAKGGIAIMRNVTSGRDTYVLGVKVYRIVEGRVVVTDPSAAWYNHGCKVFHGPSQGTFHEKQAAAFEEAKVWVANEYGELGPWVRNAFKDWVPERIQKAWPIRNREKVARG